MTTSEIPFGKKIAAKQDGISADMVRSVISYCPTTGSIRRRNTGLLAGGTKNGYIIVRIFGRNFPAHRIAWLLLYGYWPKGVIDHINRCRSDNRALNLRDVTPAENARNRTFRSKLS